MSYLPSLAFEAPPDVLARARAKSARSRVARVSGGFGAARPLAARHVVRLTALRPLR